MPTSFKLIGIGLLLSLIGLFMVQQDVRLRLWGKKVMADVMETYEATGRGGRKGGWNMVYRYTDEKGKDYRGGCAFPRGYNPADLRIEVVYLPSNPEVHRLASASAFFSYLFLLVGVALTAGGVWYFNRETVVEAHNQTAEDIEKWKEPPKPKDIARKVLRGM
jgi:hypothetical protein